MLGLDPLARQWASGAGEQSALRAALDALVASLVEQRQKARAAKDYATADAVRDRLRAAGVEVEDTPAGPRWTLA